MKKLLILLFSILISFNSYSEEVLYCPADLAVGFSKKNNTWKAGTFGLDKFIIKFYDNHTKASVGGWDMHYYCRYAFSDPSKINCIDSKYSGTSFMIDLKTNRFILSYLSFASYPSDGNWATSSIYAGTCQKF